MGIIVAKPALIQSGGSGGPDVTAESFLVLSASAQLTEERIFQVGTGLSSIDTGPNGTYQINCTVPDLSNDQFLVLSSSPDLTNERIFQVGTGLSASDGGPNGIFEIESTVPDLSNISFLVLTGSTDLANERIFEIGPGLKVTDNGPNGTYKIEINMVWQEIPSGAKNNVNKTFTTLNNPNPQNSLQVFRRGLHLFSGSQADVMGGSADYYLTGSNTIILARAPKVNDSFFINYSR